MQARMTNPATILPAAMPAILKLFKTTKEGGVPEATLELVHLRASQINGCSACVDAGATNATKAGVSPEKLLTLAAWYEDPRFDDAERAALALTEAATRLADRPGAVTDEIWAEAARHYDERLFAVAAWRESPYFTDAERAALALTEAATRLSDRADPVPDEVWDEAAHHFDEPALAALVLMIGVTNLFNRLNATTRQVAGTAW